MIMVNYRCNDCECEHGVINIYADEPVIVCDKCGESEPIKDFDILGNV